MRKVFIYTLSCPISNAVKYVGKTTHIRFRTNQHLADRRGMSKVKSWIQSLKSKGMLPVLEVIDECEESDWRFWESYWIGQIIAWGFSLKNMIDGGLGIGQHTEEVKDKISKALLGRKPPPKARLNTIKPVCQYSLDGIFIKKYESITDTGFQVGNIISAIRRKQSSYGFQWRYYESNFPEKINRYIRTPNNPQAASNSRKIKIQEVDQSGSVVSEYDSIKMAEATLNLANIGAVCAGKRKHTKGRFFKLTSINQ